MSADPNKFIYEKIPSNTLHISRSGDWLESRFHFSFANWRDHQRMNFGVLRVVNDDIVQPAKGFGEHPHKNMEIFSYIIDGELTHRDSEGNEETLSRGQVQYMSAGKGVWHSEMNENKLIPTRFLQIWIIPEKENLDVQYGSYRYTYNDRHNQLLKIISGTKSDVKSKIQLHQDCNIYVSELDYDKSISYQLLNNRQIYLVCIEGEILINDQVTLNMRDAIKLYGPIDLAITAKGNNNDKNDNNNNDDNNNKKPSAHVLMVEMELRK